MSVEAEVDGVEPKPKIPAAAVEVEPAVEVKPVVEVEGAEVKVSDAGAACALLTALTPELLKPEKPGKDPTAGTDWSTADTEAVVGNDEDEATSFDASEPKLKDALGAEVVVVGASTDAELNPENATPPDCVSVAALDPVVPKVNAAGAEDAAGASESVGAGVAAAPPAIPVPVSTVAASVDSFSFVVGTELPKLKAPVTPPVVVEVV